MLSLLRSGSPKLLFPIYALGVVGAFLQIAGAQWDVSWHILGIVETFFTPAHAVLYTGIVLVAVAALVGLLLQGKMLAKSSLPSSLFSGITVAAVGSSLQVMAAPIDFWWHSTYGFDPFLFTPAHSLLIIGLFLGGVGMILGIIRLLRASRTGLYQMVWPKALTVVVVLGLATIWADFNFLGLYITDVHGMAYTFGLCTIQQFRALSPCGFVEQTRLASILAYIMILAAGGTVVFWGTKKLFVRRGMLTGVAAIIVAVFAVTTFGFIAYALEFMSPPGSFYLTNPSPAEGAIVASFIPVYLAFFLPMVILDFLIRNIREEWTMVGLSLLVGPFAAILDGRLASNLIGGVSIFFLLVGLIVPTLLGGLLGGLVLIRYKTRFLPNLMIPAAKDLRLR